jgi:hypothetical protein
LDGGDALIRRQNSTGGTESMHEFLRNLGEAARRLFLMIHGKDQPGAALAIGSLLCDISRWRHKRGSADDLAQTVEDWVGRQLLHTGERLPFHKWKQVPEAGTRVMVVRDFGKEGMLIAPSNLEHRAIGVTGWVKAGPGGQTWVPGHGGDVVWVQHDMPEGSQCFVSAYQLVELIPYDARYLDAMRWRASVIAHLQSDLDDLQRDGCMNAAEAFCREGGEA